MMLISITLDDIFVNWLEDSSNPNGFSRDV